jgi:hypothetical protein
VGENSNLVGKSTLPTASNDAFGFSKSVWWKWKFAGSVESGNGDISIPKTVISEERKSFVVARPMPEEQPVMIAIFLSGGILRIRQESPNLENFDSS